MSAVGGRRRRWPKTDQTVRGAGPHGFLGTRLALGAAMIVGFAVPAALSGQEAGPAQRPLSLDQAVAEALQGNPELRLVRSRRAMAEADAAGAAAVYWPQLGVESGYSRSDDPVFAFGTKLRQGVFGESDFALDALNQPEPIHDWSSAVSVRWKLFSPADWSARGAAARSADAARWEETRSAEATVLQTEARYLDAQRAEALEEAAERAERAARANRDVFARRVSEGLLTRAELLQAEAELASASARRIEAARGTTDALRRLAVFLGWEPGLLPSLTDTLALEEVEAGGPEADTESPDPATRADLRALASAHAAAEADSRRASLTLLPEIGAFAGYSVHSGEAFRSDGDFWTVGVGLSWTLFDGFARQADRRRARAAEQMARERYDAALRAARAEMAEAESAVVTAGQSVAASLAADRAAAAGADLMRRRFEEGLATATDLLQAEARTAAARSRAIDAMAGYRLAVARLRFVNTRHASERQR